MAINLVSRYTPVNHWTGRSGRRIEAVVVHISDGDGSPVGWFHDPAAEVSSHYVDERDGTIVRVVREVDTAWTNGWDFSLGLARYRPDLSNPLIARWWREHTNPNLVTVTIECTGRPATGLTTAQFASLQWLVADICRRNGLPLSRERVLGHYQLDSVTRSRCPSLTAAQWEAITMPEHNPYWDQIGIGIRDAMRFAGDQPVGPERYYAAKDGQGEISVAPGEKALYVWAKDGGHVYAVPRV